MSRQKNILFIHPSDELYGADKVLLAVVAEAQALALVSVWIPKDVTYPDQKLTKELGKIGSSPIKVDLPVMRSAYLTLAGILNLLKLLANFALSLFRSDLPDLVYLNTSSLALLLPVFRLRGVPTVLHIHEHLFGFRKMAVLPLLPFATKLIFVSHAVLDASSLPGRFRSKSQVVHNGFDIKQTEQAHVDNGSDLIVLFASRWNSWKGHKEFLAIWGSLTRQDVKLWILGSQPPSGEGVDVPCIVSQMPNRDTVSIFGETDSVPDFLNRCDLVVVPSRLPDPLPTIAIEALANGRPVLSSNTGGLPEILENGISGWLLDLDNSADWISLLEGLDASQVREMGKECRSRFEMCFSSRRFAMEISEVLTSELKLVNS